MAAAERWPWSRQFRALVFAMFFFIIFICIYVPPYRSRPAKEVIGWGLSVTRDTRVYVAPGNDTSVLGCRFCCNLSSGTRNTPIAGQRDSANRKGLVVIITSAPAHFSRRSAIRNTWAANPPPGVTVTFLLGLTDNDTLQLAIEGEGSRFGDIVQEGFIDSYNNLTIKSVMMLKWFLTSCKGPNYLMKTDDDMFVNMTRLTKVVSSLNRTNTLLGYLISDARPILDHNNKWYSPRYMYGRSVYPNYLSGTGYVMSRDVASRLYRAALLTPLLHLEDVFITGICSRSVGIKPKHHSAFTLQKLEVGCYPKLATVHGFTPSQLIAAWSSRDVCSQPPPAAPSASSASISKPAIVVVASGG